MSRSTVGRPQIRTSHGQFTRGSRMGDDVIRQIQADYTESQVKKQILSIKKVSPVLKTNAELKSIAQQRPIKYRNVESYLVQEDWGTWDNASPAIRLDFFFKVDCLIQYKGWTIGIDVTTQFTDYELNKKARHITKMKRDHNQLGIDKMVVLSCQEIPTQQQLVSVLDATVKELNANKTEVSIQVI